MICLAMLIIIKEAGFNKKHFKVFSDNPIHSSLTGRILQSNLRFYFNVHQGENRKLALQITVTFSEMTVRKSGLKRKYANIEGRGACRFLGPSTEIEIKVTQNHTQVEIYYIN